MAKSGHSEPGFGMSGNRHKADIEVCADWRHNPRAPRFFPCRTPTGEANIVNLLRTAYGSEIEVLNYSGSSPRWSPKYLRVHGSHGGVPVRLGGDPNGLGGTPPLGGQHRMPCVKLRTQPLAHAFQAGLPATKRRSDERAAARLKAAETL